MPASAIDFGGKRRIYCSETPENNLSANWAPGPGQSGKALTMVLNPLDGSDTLGPPDWDLVGNANSAEGQGEFITRLEKHREKTMASPKFWLNRQTFGRFFSSPMGADTVTAFDPGGGTSTWQHALTMTDEPFAFSAEEHWRGATDVDADSSWNYTGVWAKSVTIEGKRGDLFASITPELILSRYHDVGSNQASLETTYLAYSFPPGIPIPKCGLWLAPTTGGVHTTAFDGTITGPGLPGVLAHDLGGTAIDIAKLASSFMFKYDTGVNPDDLYQAGMSTGVGMYRGKPYANARSCSLSFTIDKNVDSEAFISYFRNFTNASQRSFTMQFLAVGDDRIALSKTGGCAIVVNAMKVDAPVKPSLGTGPQTVTVNLSGIQAAAGVAYMLAWVWNEFATQYCVN